MRTPTARSLSYPRALPSTAPVVIPILLTLAGGLALAFMLPRASPVLLVGGVVGLAFLTLFLQRPDLGLLLVLIVRSSSDLLVRGGGNGLIGRLMGSPNVGLILILIFAGVLFLLLHRAPFLRLPGALPLAFLVVTGIVGMLRAPSFFMGIDRTLAMFSALVVYALVVALFKEPRRIQMVIDVIMISFIGPAVYGFYQLATGRLSYDPLEHVSRLTATFVHPAALGDYLVIVFGVFLGQALTHTGIRRHVALALLGAAAFLLAHSLARASLVGAVAIFVVVAALRNRRLLLLVPVVVAIAVLAVPSIGTRFSDPTGGSFADRVDLWQNAYQEWLFVTREDQSSIATLVNRLAGTGPGSIFNLTAPSRGDPYYAHNDYLAMLLEFGVIGLIAFLAMTVSVTAAAYRTWRQTTDPAMKAVALSFFAIAVAFGMMYFTETLVAKTENQLYFWALAGLTAAVAQQNARLRRDHPPASGVKATSRLIGSTGMP